MRDVGAESMSAVVVSECEEVGKHEFTGCCRECGLQHQGPVVVMPGAGPIPAGGDAPVTGLGAE